MARTQDDFAGREAKERRLKIGDFANEREAVRAIGLDPWRGQSAAQLLGRQIMRL
jgi:hypothetical protein